MYLVYLGEVLLSSRALLSISFTAVMGFLVRFGLEVKAKS